MDGKPVEVNLSPGKSVIASRLNMSPEHFSRTLHELITAGAIDVNGSQIIIRDAARLPLDPPQSQWSRARTCLPGR